MTTIVWCHRVTTRDIQQEIGGLVNAGEEISQDLDWAVTFRTPHKKGLGALRHREKRTPTDQTITLLSLLALARYLPLWLRSRLQTSSVCTCNIVVVIRGKRSVSHVWSAYKEKCCGVTGAL